MSLTRRRFSRQLLAGTSALLSAPAQARSWFAPAPHPIRQRPRVTHGMASGDVTATEAVIWSRCDRPARMIVEWSSREDFHGYRRVLGPVALPQTDLTAKLLLTGLPPGQRIAYRVHFEDDHGTASAPVHGSFRTPPQAPAEVFFAWSGDTCGQGYGIDLTRGGMRTYAAIHQMSPQFFVHSGDTIYADNPLSPELVLPDKSLWKQLVTEEKSQVADSLAGFRGNYRYPLLDANLRRMLADVPVFVQWDDHEVMNDWYPDQVVADPRYAERDMRRLAAWSRQAFFEYQPVRHHPDRQLFRRIPRGPLCELFLVDFRSYRGPNGPGREPLRSPATDFMGQRQLDWLKDALTSSPALWKVVCADMPIGIAVEDSTGRFDNAANGDGPPTGRELEFTELFQHLQDHRVRNVFWLTADVHYCASIHYSPARARFSRFDPFWEFVSGPLHAGVYSARGLDNTFGPEVRFCPRPAGTPTAGPWSEDQFFGTVHIHPSTHIATVSHWNRDGRKLWQIEMSPHEST